VACPLNPKSAEVFYGATWRERRSASRIGMFMGGILFFFYFMIEKWLYMAFYWRLPLNRMDDFMIILGVFVLFVLVFGGVFAHIEKVRKQKGPPRFFRGSSVH
jgi:hypothetical protein